MGFESAVKRNMLRFGSKATRLMNKVNSSYLPGFGRGLQKAQQYVNLYGGAARRILANAGEVGLAGSALAASISTGHIPTAVASGEKLYNAVKRTVREVRREIKTGGRGGVSRAAPKEGALTTDGASNGRMSGDMLSELKKVSGS
jgi:hypothetical protein